MHEWRIYHMTSTYSRVDNFEINFQMTNISQRQPKLRN